ncbi:MAG: matrixin family metalloprotease [Candidatus Melainabacteria bacterium]|nr:matrixin family metalloprotease [Candidatus Melainabacteria bacterium]
MLLFGAKSLCQSAQAVPPRPFNLANEKRHALGLLEERKFKEARLAFGRCAALDPQDPSVQYYLAVSALYSDDFKTAEHAFCRTVVMTSQDNPFSKTAKRYLSKFNEFKSLVPYSQVSSTGMTRWNRSGAPLKIHVTNGLKFPKGYSGADLTVDTCKKLYPYLVKPGFFKKLSTANDYRTEYKSAVMTGINAWSSIMRDSRIKFQYTDDPCKADILFVWCEEEGRGAVGRTFYPWQGVKDARTIIHIETKFAKTWSNHAPREITHTAMHEFGHALGLQNHSPNPDDIMYDHGTGVDENDSYKASRYNRPSNNDFVTLRALYELPVSDLYKPL